MTQLSAVRTVSLPYGPLMLDLDGLELDANERELLRDPAVGGVILFARNCSSAAQVAELCREIHALREPPLLIGIDQEGGRVQRLRAGVTRFPPQRALGRLAEAEGIESATELARDWGRLLAAELRELGIDMDFTPCVDIDWGVSAVIGDRALSDRPEWVTQLAGALWSGLQEQGLAGVAKHFPGHGAVSADSHTSLPEDLRPWPLLQADLQPFRALIAAGIPAIMPAHCLYPAIDPRAPAGFSRPWLQDILRTELGFRGIIVSDDLSMAGAAVAGGMDERVQAARSAGAELLLVCNDRRAVEQALAALHRSGPLPLPRLETLQGRPAAAALDAAARDAIRARLARL